MKTRTEIIAELQDIVKTDRQRWKDGTVWDQAIDAALRALSDSRPLTGDDTIKLDANQRTYAVPECCIDYIGTVWGTEPDIQPFDHGFPGALPRVYLTSSPDGKRLEFSFKPRQKFLNIYGCDFDYQYKMHHIMTDDDNTIRAEDEALFMTRALADLMQKAMVANVTDPIQLHRQMGSVPNEAQPSAAYRLLMNEYRTMI